MSRRYCLTLDLKNNPQLIRDYEDHHRQVPPGVIRSIRESGILDMEIHRYDNRLFMILEVNEEFSFEKKAAADGSNPEVAEWETLMWQYQQSLPGTPPGVKWVLMEKIFGLPRIEDAEKSPLH